MPSLRNLAILAFALTGGIGLFLILSENSLGPWLLVIGTIGGFAFSLPYWSGGISWEFWEIIKDFLNCRYC